MRLGFHGHYWVIPLLAAVFWTATLLGLLLIWIIDDNHRLYQPDESTVVFISDVGAAHKALFIPGTALTFAFYALTLFTERWLRHLRRIPGVLRLKERVADYIAIVFGVIGGLALLLLSILDAFNHSTAHWTFTAIFVICISISATAQTLQTMWLERDHEGRKHLRRSNIAKLCVIVFAISGAIVFAVMYGICSSQPNGVAPSSQCNIRQSVGASLEWFIAFLYDAYLCTFILDFWPATKTRGHAFDPSLVEADRRNELHEHKDGRPGQPGGIGAEETKAGAWGEERGWGAGQGTETTHVGSLGHSGGAGDGKWDDGTAGTTQRDLARRSDGSGNPNRRSDGSAYGGRVGEGNAYGDGRDTAGLTRAERANNVV